MPGARTQEQRSRATTEHLISAARELFAEWGYEATYLDAVVDKAGVTKGALYHHFRGKRALFAAVYEAEQRAVAATVRAAAGEAHDSWAGVLAGCRAFFRACLDPATQRITLLDAPAALGWEQMRELEARHCMALLTEGLDTAIKDGHLTPRPVPPLAHLLLGAMCEAAMMAARAIDPVAATHSALDELEALLTGITRRHRTSRG